MIIKDYKEFNERYLLNWRIRSWLRDSAVFLLSFSRGIDLKEEWIRFPYYHHVFNDERKGFARQLKYLKRYGDFISLDQAVDILGKEQKINGRYFCITFDDGFKNCRDNALPILIENNCPAAFFVPTDYIGCDIAANQGIAKKIFPDDEGLYSKTDPILVEFLNWDDCRQLAAAGMVIGSHTLSHTPLSQLGNDMMRKELILSKAAIERELNIPCRHFCCPWGIPSKSFDPEKDPFIVEEAGYSSFLTTVRGPNCQGDSPFNVKRDRMIALWGDYQLKYFFSQP